MASVSYVAKRSLQGGVSVDDNIDLDFNASVIDRSTKPIRSEQISIGGVQETLRDRTDILFTIKTSPVLEADFDDFRQWFDSVDGGEQFTLDPYGTIASPVDAQICVLTSKGYKEKRVSQRYISATITARVLT